MTTKSRAHITLETLNDLKGLILETNTESSGVKNVVNAITITCGMLQVFIDKGEIWMLEDKLFNQ